MTLSAILADITTIVTSSVSWGGSIVTFITENPIILIGFLFAFVGYGVHLVKMLIRG